ncbi:Shedu anti-phage system protein SduA domain-containing protein [Cellulomonas triticagri]|uniref:Shedu anti-phage system protein SduA domain-containing protein n=1 Tax=Cellulomonas triticagri TaxID=2483352 RepID=UPI0011C39CE8|nr:Shedu anti-phage system protein SduA domain-containing protein [Cellulomonas triticagri]
MNAEDLQEDAGSVVETNDGNELVLSWLESTRDAEPVEVIRYEPSARLLRIFPMVQRGWPGGLGRQFDELTEIQLDIGATQWDPENHTGEGDNGHLQAIGLPKGFESTYAFGIGIERGFQGLFRKIEKLTTFTLVRIVAGAEEGEADGVFRISVGRFARWVAAVKTNRQRGSTAVRRVNEAESHNLLADLLDLERVEPAFRRHPLINAITEVVATGHLLGGADRGSLVAHMAQVAPVVAQEDPVQFGQLRQDVELASLKVIIRRFNEGLSSAAGNAEDYWQDFFRAYPFALQQLFSAPVKLYREHLHVRGSNAEGRGQRITDFAYVNPVTLSTFIIEIKTPATPLTSTSSYRGASGSGSEAYPPSPDLSGAVAQVQAQVASMREDFPDLKRRTPGLPDDIDPHDVHGAVIVGRVGDLDSGERLASFKRYRSGLAGVTVIGFDEVLERLRGLHAMLSNPVDVDVEDGEVDEAPPAARPRARRLPRNGERASAGGDAGAD